MALVADRGSRRNLGTGKSLSFVSFDAHMTCDLHFKCSKIEVLSIEGGIPVGSVYA